MKELKKISSIKMIKRDSFEKEIIEINKKNCESNLWLTLKSFNTMQTAKSNVCIQIDSTT